MKQLSSVPGSAPITKPGKVVIQSSEVRLTRAVVVMATHRRVMIAFDPQTDSATATWVDGKGRSTRPVDAAPQVKAWLKSITEGQKFDRLIITATRDGESTIIHVLALDCSTRGSYEGVLTIGGERGAPGLGFETIVRRAVELANGMTFKSAIAAPDCPAVGGQGKKGVFGVFDADGMPAEVSDDELETAYVAHSRFFLPLINESLVGRPLADDELGVVSASPDVWTGPRWDRIARLLRALGLPNGLFTVRPVELGGMGVSSADPTAAGVVEAALTAASARERGLVGKRVFIDGGGEVTRWTLRHLADLGVDMSGVTVADPSPERCAMLHGEHPGLVVMAMATQDALRSNAVGSIDMLLVNGPGNQIGEDELAFAIAYGCRVVVGGANDLFVIAEERRCADLMAAAGVWSVPAPLVNFGGWLIALTGQLAHAAGVPQDDGLADRVRTRTRELVRRAVLEAIDLARTGEDGDGGLDVYAAGQALIRQRLDEVRSRSLTPTSAGDLLERLLGQSNA